MEEKYTFTFQLTKEEVKEMEKALRGRQDKNYETQLKCKEGGITMHHQREEALRNFMIMQGLIEQFERQELDYSLV